MSRKKLLWALVGLALLDMVIPVPFFAVAAIYIVLKRPIGFLDWVRRLYAWRPS